MGIKGLTRLIQEFSPEGCQEISLANLSGQTIAIDASMTLYQFMIAIRQGNFAMALVNSKGEPTSHISGLIPRIIALLELGIRPVYVFDGEPPEAKSDTILKRIERKQEALKLLEEAKEAGDLDEIRKQTSRTVRVSKEQSKQAMRFLELCGIPVVQAAQEAEAQCAYLVKWGLADAASTEDADCLTFGTPILIRNLSNAISSHINKNSKNNPRNKSHLLRIDLNKTLNGLKLDTNQFVDLCILCGCDYCGKLKGIGPKKALSLIQKYKSIENIISDTDNNYIDEDFDFKMARREFLSPRVLIKEKINLEWREPNIPELIHFLVDENGFNKDRIDKFINRLLNIRKVKPQQQISSFFSTKLESPIKSSSNCILKDIKIEESKESKIEFTPKPTHIDNNINKSNDKRTLSLLQVCPNNIKVRKGNSSKILKK